MLVRGCTYPEHISISEMAPGVPLLGVNEVRELGRITNEEDRGVVEDPIPVTLVGPEFDGEASRVTGCVSRARLTTDS